MSKTFFDINKEVRQAVDSRLERLFQEKKAQARSIDPRTSRLIENIEKVVRRGGKRLRPTLAVIGYRAGGGKDMEHAIDAAVAVELLHAFMLIHDDVMDQDYVRHGGKNIGGIYKKLLGKNLSSEVAIHTADSMAILAGDLVFSWSFDILADCGLNAATLSRLVRHQSRVIFDTAAGQQLDVLLSLDKSPTLRQVMKVPHYKTGLYSFVAPLQFGTILAGAKEAEEFTHYGANLGIAFQLIDDDLGMFGSSRQTGKPVQSDLEENKPTLLRHYGLKLAPDQDKEVLRATLGRQGLTDKEVKRARKILTDCGARAKVLITAEQYGSRAKDQLRSGNLDQDTVGYLEQLADFCLRRDH